MESPRSPPGSVRRHGRNISHPIRTSATRGPLEDAEDDPLANPSTSPSGASTSETTQSIHSAEQQQTSTPAPALPEPAVPQITRPPVELRFLRDPDRYHQILVDDIPKAFLESKSQPTPDSALPELLEGGHFRLAAERALRSLLSNDSDPLETVFELLYVRLACLVLISRPDLAAEEAIPLIDWLARGPPGVEDVQPLIPWDLRLLLVRLQSIGASDGGRRGIMALYALTGEVRANLRNAREKRDGHGISVWSSRLQDLGLRVCDALVEMGELETATRHLDCLRGVDPDESAYRKALLRVRVGDASGARRCASGLKDETRKKSLEALLEIASGDYSANSWQSLVEEYPSHELFAQNAAVSLLYTGHITSARDVLEDLSSRLPMFPTLLFNLSTVYELCTERAVEQKTSLIEQAVSKSPCPESGGWERANFEFKL